MAGHLLLAAYLPSFALGGLLSFLPVSEGSGAAAGASAFASEAGRFALLDDGAGR